MHERNENAGLDPEEIEDLSQRIAQLHRGLQFNIDELLREYDLNAGNATLLSPDQALDFNATYELSGDQPKTIKIEDILFVFDEEDPELNYPTRTQVEYMQAMAEEARQTYSQLRSAIDLAAEMDVVPADLQKLIEAKKEEARTRYHFLITALIYMTLVLGGVNANPNPNPELAATYNHYYKALYGAFIYFHNHALQE